MDGWAAADVELMREALTEASTAATANEVPVGAVISLSGRIIGRGHNSPVGDCDPTAHAEINALRAAAESIGNYRLNDCELFVTLEPCAMCFGAMLHARIRRLVFAAYDDKAGAVGSVIDLSAEARLNHRIEVAGGLLQNEATELLEAFFAARR